ncbi:MAG: hypothetical protein WCZ17_09280, partial [Candidatus Kapaibacterium sp.]
NFKYLLNHNFLYYHLGNTFIILGILALLSNLFKIPPIIASVGKKTMMIYVLHIFIIYGTGISKGIQYYIGQSLSGWVLITTAVMTLAFFMLLVYYIEKSEPFFQKKFPYFFQKKKII